MHPLPLHLVITKLYVNFILIARETKLKIKTAIARYNNYTCIRFIETKPAQLRGKDYIEFIYDANGGCASGVGRYGGKQQVNNLNRTYCIYHELHCIAKMLIQWDSIIFSKF